MCSIDMICKVFDTGSDNMDSRIPYNQQFRDLAQCLHRVLVEIHKGMSLTRTKVVDMRNLTMSCIAAVVMMAGVPAAANAAFTLDESLSKSGNYCSGQSFTECTLNGSPVIGKFEFNDDGSISNFEPGFFGTTNDDGNVFERSFTFGINEEGDRTWSYSLSSPEITGFVVKGSNAFNVYTGSGDSSVGWTTPINNGGNPSGLSHITFFDTVVPNDDDPGSGIADIPAPATFLLLGLGLLSLGWFSRRSKA